MRVEHLVESKSSLIQLESGEVDLLRSLGRQLASSRGWWGSQEASADLISERSIVRVEAVGAMRFLVTVPNMVGVIRLPSVQLHVVPKIPLEHFVHLLGRCELAPRSSSAQVALQSSSALFEVLGRWCLDETERLLRGGLRPDYQSFLEEQSAVRGHLVPCDTMLENLKGRPVAVCAFDELSEDAPLNRVLLGACQRLAQMDMLTKATRTRARAVVYRMTGIGPIQPGDDRAEVDRLAVRYAQAIPLARLILAGSGISLACGNCVGTAFLIRTPELIESGLRAVVAAALEGVSVAPGRLMLAGTHLSMNPDFVIDGGRAVGDIKYKFMESHWHRGDLYQSIAFATSYRARQSLVVGFSSEPSGRLPLSVRAGSVSTSALAWLAGSTVSPAASEARLRSELRSWYDLALSNVPGDSIALADPW
ncbi:MAG: hypothetical protein CFE40_14110 [Burkholderiales bacterium PBB1]|nr:MAG: hypothetical protein CFE40_14110 [Burkholderiales bacterium PBB1]